MSVTFHIHMEPANDEVVWWAEADAVPGLSVAAPTLRELRTLIDEAARLRLGGDVEISLELIADVDDTGSDTQGITESATLDLPMSVTPPIRRTLIHVA